ncbi:MAG: nucleotide sugar dehydrogenase [Candidatus Thermoplasmatota archaeon]|nr:nucleotide sugar dehydrogenase [Candidatus Thermoplasmatota archaeon]
MKVAVVGLGKAGLPLAAVIAEAGLDVVGIDVDKKRCKQINDGVNPIPEEAGLEKLIKKYGGKTLIATSIYADAKDCTFFVVIVPLFIDEQNNADFSLLENAFRNVGKLLKKGDCVVLETTVPPGTTEKIVKDWLEKESGLVVGDFYLAHSPERIMTGYSISRLKEFPKIIGGVDAASGQKAYDVYRYFIGSLSLVSSSRVAEFVKVIEGCYRFTNIALANELFKIALELDIDFYESQKAANHEFCHIHLPSTGVGGHCIPVYPWFLIKQMKKQQKEDYTVVLKASHTVNEDMIKFFSQHIIQHCKKINKPLKKVRICITGVSFRKGVKSIYKSRSIALAKYLEKLGMDVYVYDELYSKEEIEQMKLSFLTPDKADVVFDPFTLKIEILK